MTPRWTLSNNTMIPDGDSELLSGTRAGAEGGDDAGGRLVRYTAMAGASRIPGAFSAHRGYQPGPSPSVLTIRLR